MVGDVGVDVVLHENADDVVTAHLARVAERRATARVLQIHVGAFIQQQLKRLAARLFLLTHNQ